MERFLSIFLLILTSFLLMNSTDGVDATKGLKLLSLTVATDENDGFKRFMRSANIFDIPVKVSGIHGEREVGEAELYPGAGQKLNLLRKEIELVQNRTNLVVIVTNSYDVIFTAGTAEILNKFVAFNARIVISTGKFIWPGKNLESYQLGRDIFATEEGERFICSGGVIGYAPDVYKLMTARPVEEADNDKLYCIKLYLDEDTKNKLQIKLDNKSEIFQNLNGSKDEIEIETQDSEVWLENTLHGTKPLIILNNGPSKLFLNYIANYIPNGWNPVDGCVSCSENTFSLKDYQPGDYPSVLLAIFVEKTTPFLSEFFKRLAAFDYPKERIDVFIHNVEPFHEEQIQTFVSAHGKGYKSVHYVRPRDLIGETKARNHAVEHCISRHCKYLFVMDADAVITEPRILKILMEQNRSIIAPKISRYGKLWSNFWGDIRTDGFYARSRDYVDIVTGRKRGVWNVPYISTVYLVHISMLKQVKNPYSSKTFEADMAFCAALRSKGIFMYVDNLVSFGRVLDTSTMDTTRKHSDMYQIFNNKLDWEEKYLHQDYYKIRTPEWKIAEPCPDVYWIPLFSETFAIHLWQECEHFGQWSGGGHKDDRLVGGYENVPTIDIHMNQIGFEAHWLHFLKNYVAPIANYIFTGYYSEARAIMNFVVKYNPAKQYFLRPHHDSSTYTINVALNRRGVDYEGGGVRFTRYNCSVSDTRVGWALMNPGRLTHQHEGLPTTKGTRYIMVCFVDP